MVRIADAMMFRSAASRFDANLALVSARTDCGNLGIADLPQKVIGDGDPDLALARCLQHAGDAFVEIIVGFIQIKVDRPMIANKAILGNLLQLSQKYPAEHAGVILQDVDIAIDQDQLAIKLQVTPVPWRLGTYSGACRFASSVQTRQEISSRVDL